MVLSRACQGNSFVHVGHGLTGIGVAAQPGQIGEEGVALPRGSFRGHKRQSSLKSRRGSQPGVRSSSPLTGPDEPVSGARIGSLPEVIRYHVRIRRRLPKESLCHTTMPSLPTQRRHSFVECFADQCMLEAHAGCVGQLRQHMGFHSAFDNSQERFLVRACYVAPDRKRHVLANDRGNCQQMPCRVALTSQTGFDHFAQKRRHPHAAQFTQVPIVVQPLENSFLFECP